MESMGRTYGSARSIVKCALSSGVTARTGFPVLLLGFLIAAAPAARAQGLPDFAPLNPMASSRSGLYYQPYRDPAPGRWVAELGVDYASVIEYNRLTRADYVLDSELLRVSLGLSRDLGSRTFLTLAGSVGGAYAGFMDGFLDWYHGALGIRIVEREKRPQDRFLYIVTLPDGSSVRRSRSDLFFQDIRVGLGVRSSPRHQMVLSLTLPTATGPMGYGRGTPSVALLNTLRSRLKPDLVYEGSLGLGYTPAHGDLLEEQRRVFLAVTSGLRLRVWGHQSLFA